MGNIPLPGWESSTPGTGIVFSDKLGASDCSDIPVVNVQVERPLSPLAEAFYLSNLPNPFNATTTISFYLPSADNVRLQVYDLLGRPVITLIDEFRPAGPYEVMFDGSDIQSGVYVYQLVTSQTLISKLMVLNR